MGRPAKDVVKIVLEVPTGHYQMLSVVAYRRAQTVQEYITSIMDRCLTADLPEVKPAEKPADKPAEKPAEVPPPKKGGK